MLTCVMGLPTEGNTGFALRSILELDAASASESALGTGNGAFETAEESSFFGGGLTGALSLVVVRCGMLRMSL